MTKCRYVGIILILLILGLASGCAGNAAKGRLSFLKPERTVNDNVYLGGENIGGMGESALRAKLAEHAARNDIPVQNASIDPATWEISPEKTGKRLDTEKTLASLINAEKGSRVGYITVTVEPKVTTALLKGNIHVIADYTTPILDDRDSRVNNIEIAVDKINGKVLLPGEEFSFNNIVGRRTAAKGYREAPIIIRTPAGPARKLAKGGGVCQVSTTLYNAVEECGLKITERHLHSLDVGYVPKGEDATVSFGTADFRFVNNRDKPLRLRLYLKGNNLTVKILENMNSIN